jgi:hypothetical protein
MPDIANPAQTVTSLQANGASAMMGVIKYKGTSSSNATLQVSLLHPQYYFNHTRMNNNYFAQYGNIGLKVTDGWTSETSRDGYTLLPILRSTTGTINWFFNMTGNSSTQSDTHYDLPRTYFLHGRINSSSYDSNTCRVCSAIGGYAPNHGKDVVQKIGGWWVFGYNTPLHTQHMSYYNTNYAIDSESACNSFELGILVGSYYGPQVDSGDRGSNTTTRFNNLFHENRNSGYPNNNNNNNGTFKMGTILANYGESGAMWRAAAGTNVVVLDNAHFYKQYYQGGGLVAGVNLSFEGTAYNRDTSPYFAQSYWANNHSGPEFAILANGEIPLVSNVPLAFTDFVTSAGIYVENNTGTHKTASDNCAIGILDVGTGDYTTDDFMPTVKIDRQTYALNNFYHPTNAGVTPIHFSSNTQDGRPIGLMCNAVVSSGFKTPIIYYNDQNKADALCIKCNGLTPSGYSYVMALEQQIPAYTASSTVTFAVNVESESTFTRLKRMNIRYVDNTGTLVSTTLFSTSGAITTPTDYSLSVSGANMYLSANGTPLRHCRFYIEVQNEPTNRSKMWINSMTVTVT